MKIINFTILILTVLTIYSFAQTKNFDTTFNYYPLTIGNTWDYDYGVPDSGSAFTRIIIDTINYISHNYYIIEEAYGSPPSNFINRYTRLDTLGNLWEYDNYNGEEYLRFNFTKDDSATYNWFEYTVTVYRNITIKTFAGQLGIDPGIIVGRLQHENYLEKSWHNNLRSRYEWEDRQTTNKC